MALSAENLWDQAKSKKSKRAIGKLTQQELEELKVWLDEYAGPQPIEQRIEKDLAAGRLDKAVKRALEDKKQGRGRQL